MQQNNPMNFSMPESAQDVKTRRDIQQNQRQVRATQNMMENLIKYALM